MIETRPQPGSKIAAMRAGAYHQLGINNAQELEARTNGALKHLCADREHTWILLMFSDPGNRYVYSCSYAKLYPDPSQNIYPLYY